jgi:hypothetical protein
MSESEISKNESGFPVFDNNIKANQINEILTFLLWAFGAEAGPMERLPSHEFAASSTHPSSQRPHTANMTSCIRRTSNWAFWDREDACSIGMSFCCTLRPS